MPIRSLALVVDSSLVVAGLVLSWIPVENSNHKLMN